MAEYESISSVLRWIGRVWSIASLLFLAIIVVGELARSHSATWPTGTEMLMLLFFPLGVCTGMILAWRRQWEGLGGAITLTCLLAFHAINHAGFGDVPSGPWFALVATPGAFFLTSWILTDGLDGQIAAT